MTYRDAVQRLRDAVLDVAWNHLGYVEWFDAPDFRMFELDAIDAQITVVIIDKTKGIPQGLTFGEDGR